MIIDLAVVTNWLTFFGEVFAICLGIYTYIKVKIIGRIEKTEADIKELQKDKEDFSKELEIDKEERIIIIKALSACLDGLGQLGANHNVSNSKKEIDDFLLRKSHE